MLGQIIWDDHPPKGTPIQQVELMGLTVFLGRLKPCGRFYGWREKRLLREFRRQGVRRLLVPSDFHGWERAHQMGLTGVDILPFLRSNGGTLLLLAMKKEGYQPSKCAVALRGTRVGRDMALAAEGLVPCVRDLSVSAPHGGERLQQQLRQRWGLGVAPDGEGVDGVIRFDEGGGGHSGVEITLFGRQPWLGGLAPDDGKCPQFSTTEPLSLLAALWEAGKIGKDELEFYLT